MNRMKKDNHVWFTLRNMSLSFTSSKNDKVEYHIKELNNPIFRNFELKDVSIP